MAFTIYGPGIRDEVLLDNLFEQKQVEQPDAIDPSRRIDDQHSPPGEQLARQQAQRAYQQTANLPREREPAILAYQVMTAPVVSLQPDTRLTEAWRVFRERRFRHIPVLNEVGRIYGIISDRDLLRYAAVNGRVPPYGEDSPESQMMIRDMVKTRVVTATPDTEIRQIARVLFEKRIGAMPVVNREEQLIGIITRADILRTLVNTAPLELWT